MAQTQTGDLEAILEKAVRALVEAVDPEQIILFGSAARGEFGEDSDLDFLVVVDRGEFSRQKRMGAIEALRDLEVPKDIFYTTRERLERYGDVRWTLEESATREGRRLYARP